MTTSPSITLMKPIKYTKMVQYVKYVKDVPYIRPVLSHSQAAVNLNDFLNQDRP